jgi:hypothetical protein
MGAQRAYPAEFEIGRFFCPNSKSWVSLTSTVPLAFVHWPMVVECCPDCGLEHVLNLADVQHPPVYGYE